MIKYDLLPEQLVYEGTISSENIFNPTTVSHDEILKVHSQNYWDRLRNLELTRSEERKTGFPLSRTLVDREQIIARGTIDCAKYAIEHGVAMNIAGGTHHAFSDRGEGFCLLNDLAIAATYLLDHGIARKVLIIDLDVHQGNGTAEIFKDQPAIFTFSMHGEKNYPYLKQKSDRDVPLPDGTDDGTYMKLLDRHLGEIMDSFQPDFAFFQSGVDVLHTDKLGRLGLTIDGCRKRDRHVFRVCKENSIPVVAVMGGGYSEDLKQIIDAHANTYRTAQDLYF